MNREIDHGSDALWAAFNKANKPNNLRQILLSGLYHQLGISVQDGQQKAIAISRGNDEAKTSLRRASAFYPGVAEIIKKSISQETSENFTIGCNTFFLAICEEPSEELETALVAMEAGVDEEIVQDAYKIANDPSRLNEKKTNLSINSGNVVPRLCEAIDVSASNTYNSALKSDELQAYRRGCYTALFAFAAIAEA